MAPKINIKLPSIPDLEGDDFFNKEVSDHMEIYCSRSGAKKGDRHYNHELSTHIRDLNQRGMAAVDTDPNSRLGKVNRSVEYVFDKSLLGRALHKVIKNERG